MLARNPFPNGGIFVAEGILAMIAAERGRLMLISQVHQRAVCRECGEMKGLPFKSKNVCPCRSDGRKHTDHALWIGLQKGPVEDGFKSTLAGLQLRRSGGCTPSPKSTAEFSHACNAGIFTNDVKSPEKADHSQFEW